MSTTVTNADRIRAMTDEELAGFLDRLSTLCIDCSDDTKNEICPIYNGGVFCSPEDMLKWLQMPAEEAE